jgi:hypothetical protein
MLQTTAASPNVLVRQTQRGEHDLRHDEHHVRLEHLVGGAHLHAAADVADAHAVYLVREEAALALQGQGVHHRREELGRRVRPEELRELLIGLVGVAGVAVALDELTHNAGCPLLQLYKHGSTRLVVSA